MSCRCRNGSQNGPWRVARFGVMLVMSRLLAVAAEGRGARVFAVIIQLIMCQL